MKWRKAFRVDPLSVFRSISYEVGGIPDECRVRVQEVDEVSPVWQEFESGTAYGKWFSPVVRGMISLTAVWLSMQKP